MRALKRACDKHCSVMRDDKHFKLLFERAGCSLQLEAQQQHFPQELKMVKMYALA